MADDNKYKYSTGEFLFDSEEPVSTNQQPSLITSGQKTNNFTIPGTTRDFSNIKFTPNFDASVLYQPTQQTVQQTQAIPETYQTKTFDRDAKLKEMYGTNASKRDIRKFNKYWNSDQRWADQDAFEAAEHQKYVDSLDQRWKAMHEQMKQKTASFVNSVQGFVDQAPGNAIQPKQIQKQSITPSQQESAYAKAKREGNTKSLVVSTPINEENIFTSNIFNNAGKPFTGTFNNEQEFDEAYTNWRGERPGYFSSSANDRRKWDDARNKMLQEYFKFHNIQGFAQPEQTKHKLSPWVKRGGQINKHQQGGTMQNEQELQKAFMAFLIEDAAAQGMQIQSEQDLQAYAQQLGEEGLKAKYQEFMQKMQGGVKAALGAKLNYIHKLKGNCPEGEELVYMKQGGRMCPVCQKKAEKAENGKKLKNKNAVSDFKEKRKQINPNDTVNTKFGPRDLNGKTKYPKYNAKKENYNFETRMRVQEKDEKSGKKVIGSACGSKMKKK